MACCDKNRRKDYNRRAKEAQQRITKTPYGNMSVEAYRTKILEDYGRKRGK